MQIDVRTYIWVLFKTGTREFGDRIQTVNIVYINYEGVFLLRSRAVPPLLINMRLFLPPIFHFFFFLKKKKSTLKISRFFSMWAVAWHYAWVLESSCHVPLTYYYPFPFLSCTSTHKNYLCQSNSQWHRINKISLPNIANFILFTYFSWCNRFDTLRFIFVLKN